MADSQVSHNEVYNLPGPSISNGYGWNQNDDGGSKDAWARGIYKYQALYTPPTTSGNNQFIANYLHDSR